MIAINSFSSLLISTEHLTIILLVTASVFIVLIGIAIIKMYKLKAENKRLIDSSPYKIDESYKDFTEGHLYENK
ncbi:hypothetical protein [Paucihalobacter sp.]|uniref:hypothetical protein n=1 Tax=Paucihalobacter sp. TaxID=2850405 RepID=UPI002FE30BF2